MAARKKRIALRRYVVPLVFVCCLVFVGASSAKMFSGSPIAKSSEARIAAWSVDVSSSDDNNMTLDAGKDAQTYSLLVTNNSEVASAYSIKVSNIPDGVKVGLDIASGADLTDLETPVDGVVVLANTGGDLGYEAPDNVRTHTLTLVAEATAAITQSSVGMTIEVLFEQKDPQL